MRQEYNIQILRGRRKELRRRETKAENILWQCVRKKKLGVKFYRQYSVGRYVLDFYCAEFRIAVELDGGYHKKLEVK